jgi:hypothetical protein
MLPMGAGKRDQKRLLMASLLNRSLCQVGIRLLKTIFTNVQTGESDGAIC